MNRLYRILKTYADYYDDDRPARYDEAAAKLAWKRTVAHFKKNLGG